MTATHAKPKDEFVKAVEELYVELAALAEEAEHEGLYGPYRSLSIAASIIRNLKESITAGTYITESVAGGPALRSAGPDKAH